jgi:hypothetical protein
MAEMIAGSIDEKHVRSNKMLTAAILALALVLFGLLANLVLNAQRAASLPPGPPPLSQSALEEQYGLNIYLVGVTAAGGMVDFRMKVVDAEKARLLLQEKANYPVLFVNDSAITLKAPEESQAQETQFNNGDMIHILFPNSQNAVKPGSKVTVIFGNTRLEPVVAQ